jgi:peptidoglycan/LPS O-acetylase OafA/YrhL
MRLSSLAQSKDNNFKLIRFVAAFVVLVAHSFVLAGGIGAVDPVGKILGGIPYASVAVDIFFVTSGFLVTGSLLTRKRTLEFLWARFLRIYPALIVMVLLTVFALGPFFTTVPLSSYLTAPATYIYLLLNGTLFAGVTYILPGVFESVPYKGPSSAGGLGPVNGSLWTLPYEVKMYAILVTVWIALGIARNLRLKAFNVTIVVLAAVSMVVYIAAHFYPPSQSNLLFVRLYFMFFTGAACYVMRNRIVLSRPVFWLAVAAVILSTIDRQIFFVVYVLLIPYIVLYIAYIPSGKVRTFNRVGDYSYGTYIYAFPVQQSVASLIPGISGGMMLIVSSVVTLMLAAVSWHLVEKRALALKGATLTFHNLWSIFTNKGSYNSFRDEEKTISRSGSTRGS